MTPSRRSGAAWLARNNRAKQDQNRKRAQPGFALRARGVFAVIAALFAHDLKPAPVTAGLEISLVEPGNDECRGCVFAFHHVKQPISFPRRIFAPGVCDLLHRPRIEGWAERRETFGCSAKHP